MEHLYSRGNASRIKTFINQNMESVFEYFLLNSVFKGISKT